MIALFVGRFQPLHNGHLNIINKLLNEHEKVIIGIGSSGKHDTEKNPFSFKERKDMLNLALKKDNYEIIQVPDTPTDKSWVEHLEHTCPKFDIVYSGNPKTKHCFENTNYKLIEIKKEINISSTEVRERIKEDKDWESLVPKQVVDYIKDNHLIQKIKIS